MKRFWIFMLITSAVAFIANVSAQMALQGDIDVQRALTISLTLGIVLAIVMASQHRQAS